MAQINYTATADLKSFSTWLTNNVDQNASTWDSTTHEGVLVLNSGVTYIGNTAFYQCLDLLTINIPNVITTIRSSAFSGCTGLTSITLPDSLIYLQGYVFSGCTGLTSITLPDSLTRFEGTSNFKNCTGLTSIDLSSVIEISDNDFNSCTGLTTVTFGNSLKKIGSSAFQNCTNLVSFNIPQSVISISWNSFKNTSWWNSQVNGIIYKDNWCLGYKNITPSGDIIIDNNIYGICADCFNGYTGITSITLPNTLLYLCDQAFYGCTGLTSMTFPNSLTKIGAWVLLNCPNLTTIYWNAIDTSWISAGNPFFWGNSSNVSTIILGDSVQNIPNKIFGNNNNLTTVTCLATTPPTLGTDNFTASGDTLYVPVASVSAYQNNSAWSSAFTNIEAIPAVINYTATADLKAYSSWCTTNVDQSLSTWDSTTQEGVLVLNNGVTEIGQSAFQNCTTITKVTIGEGITTIGNNAFNGCTGLTGSLVIPDSVTSIGQSAFQGCTGLTTVTIGSGVTSITILAFQGCTGLTTVNFNATNCTYMGVFSNPVFKNCSSFSTLNIGENVTNIPAYAFYGCTRLTSITIPNSVTSIGNQAFRSCNGLTTVTIGSGVTSISGEAFWECSGLTSVYYTGDVADWCGIAWSSENSNPLKYAHKLYINNELVTNLVIPDSVTEVKSYAFNGCDLTSVTIHNSVTNIGNQAFYGCSSLASIIVDSGNTKYDSRNNCNAIIETATNTLLQGCMNTVIPNSVTSIGNNAFNGCTGLTGSLVIPNSVTSIGNNAFNGCTGLTGSLVIPNSVTSIGSQAFKSCYGLTSVTLGSGVTSISGEAFRDCRGLTSLTIGNSITSIGQRAFSDCRSLTSVTCLSTTPPSLSTGNFTASGDTLYVPVASKSAYQNASQWSTAFTNYVGLCEVTSTFTGRGSVSPSSATVPEGESVTLTITPDTGYGIFSVTDNGTSVPVTSTGMTYTISNIAGDHAIAVVFKPLFTITTSAGTGGSITPTMTVMQNEDATVVITPNAGYSVSHVYVDGVDQGSILNYSFQNVVANHTVTAEFVALYTVSTTTTEGGTITPESSTVVAGSDVTLTITPDEGMLIFNVLDNDTPVPVLNPLGMTYTISNIQENHTVEAIFMVAQNYGFDLSEMIDTDFIIQTLDELEERK